jgi:hypothetical protein
MDDAIHLLEVPAAELGVCAIWQTPNKRDACTYDAFDARVALWLRWGRLPEFEFLSHLQYLRHHQPRIRR